MSDNDFKYLSQECTDELLKLVKRKGVYPYEYADSFEKFFEDKLPNRCKFFSSSEDECISEKRYLHAINIWNTLKRKTVGDHNELYLKTDVFLLADTFEKFISTCLGYYGLDPCHYFSNHRLRCDAVLKMTEIKLKLISDIDMYMYLFIEKGMRGGVSYIAKRFSKVNNKYIKYMDYSRPSKYTTYLDANNLYGWTMSQYLPYSGFKWLNWKEIEKIDVNSISEHGSDEYILEVDLKYPDELHDLHNYYLLPPENFEVSHNILSNYCSNVANKIRGVNKLVPNLVPN